MQHLTTDLADLPDSGLLLNQLNQFNPLLSRKVVSNPNWSDQFGFNSGIR
jgi:hypothetical protein